MAQLVIPTFSKLELAFPDAVFELYQQMKSKDSLSFQALGSQDVIYNVNIKKLEGFVSQFHIESTDPEASVLLLKEDSLCCELRGITSEAFLLPGNVTNEIEKDGEQKEDILDLVPSPSHQDVLSPDVTESQEDTILTAMATTVTTGDIDLDIPKTETPTMENIIPAIMPLDGISLVTPGEDLTSQEHEMGGVESLPLEGDEPQEIATAGQVDGMKNKSDDEKEKCLNASEKCDIVEIVFGRNKKITVNRGDEMEILREEVQMKHDKMVQSEVTELLDATKQDIDDVMATSFNLDMTLTEAALAVDRAQDAVKELVQKKSTQKFVDQSCQMAKFPIIMEGNKYRCHLCGLLLIKKHYLIAHMRYVHKICVRDPLSRLQCPKCDCTFVRKNRLDEHIAHKHTDRKNHFCDIAGCSMAFKTVYNLRDHKRIYHYHMLRYACDICGKLYENPNTAERHRHICASKDPEKYGKKLAEELKNPDWLPIDQLFMREPLPKKPKSKNKQNIQIKEEIGSEDNKKAEYDSTESLLLIDASLTDPANLSSLNSKAVSIFTIKSEESEDLTTGVAINGEIHEEEPLEDNGGNYSERQDYAKHRKRKTVEIFTDEPPIVKKCKQDEKDDKTNVKESSTANLMVAKVKVEDGENQYSDPSHSSVDTPHTKSSSGKATQLPLRDLLKFIKKKEAANKKQQTTENCHKSGKVQLGASSESNSSEVKSEKSVPAFTVTGILNKHKVYPLKCDELRRRLYGPETLNSVALMSFINKSEQWNKMAELKKQLVEIGFNVPRFTAVTSSFTKLCEGEMADIFMEFQELQQTYLKAGLLEKCLVNRLLASRFESAELAIWLGQIRDLLHCFQKILYDHMTDFDHVTHTLAKHVFRLFLSLYEDVLTEAVSKFQKVQAFYEELPEKPDQKRPAGGTSQEGRQFEVQSVLSIQNTSYHVTSEEIHRRSQFPEQMAISLLQQYIHKTKDKLDLEKECEMDGIILQRGNRTQVKSCFSLLIEAEANKLCTDFEILFDDHIELDDIVREFVKVVSTETKKGQLLQKLHNIGYVAPYLEKAVHEQCRDFDLVTHGIGAQLADFTWTTFVKVVNNAKDFCNKI